jgi:hypothetical protein
MQPRDYEVTCLMCSAEVGRIVHGQFEMRGGRTTPLPRKAGLPRCCYCGGSLYLEPIISYTPPLDRAQLEALRKIVAA